MLVIHCDVLFDGASVLSCSLVFVGLVFAGVFFDLGRPVIGGWLGGGRVIKERARDRYLLWGSEHSQEGAVLFAVDIEQGEVVEQHEIGAREVGAPFVDAATGLLYCTTYQGINQPGNLLWRRERDGRLRSLGFPPIPGNRFLCAVLGRDGRIYAGTHPDGHLAAYDLARGEWRDLGCLAPPPLRPGQQVFLSGLCITPGGEVLGSIMRALPRITVIYNPLTGETRVLEGFEGSLPIVEGERLYLNRPSGVEVYDAEFHLVETVTVESLRCEGLITPSSSTLSVAVGDGQGRLYGWCSHDLVRIDPDARTIRVIGHLNGGGTIELTDDGRAVIPSIPERRYTVVDLHSGKTDTRTFVYAGQRATDICGLAKGPDGKIYGATIISMHLFRFDPSSRELTDLGHVGWPGGEVYDLIAYDDRMYLGSYTGAIWGEYDPAQPWRPDPATHSTSPASNPRNLGPLGEQQNRPFEYAVGPDRRIYIACRSDYGVGGGALACYDPATGTKTVYRDHDQSIQSVAANDRYVYGGTSIRGGRGWAETTCEGRLFVFDPGQRRRIFELVPVTGAIAVTSLAVSPVTRLVYGTTDTCRLFAFDPDALQVVQTWTLRNPGTPLMGVPEAYGIIHLTAGSDGDIYGVTRYDVFKLDLSTGRIIYLDQPPIPDLYQIVEGAPGVFYIGARSHLLEYHLRDIPHYR
ncbi:MAG: PQQ-binding-like beta-propeller repeat protein [Candidatus Latescibacteria bacterium]|nr:PQQ-binding-like beta-propeller repeat protein [Candidatus Latescibacterota bacterium]